MAVFDFPLYRVLNVSRALLSATAVQRSPFSGRSQAQFWGGRWWSFDVEMSVTTRADGRLLDAFFARLQGQRHTFLFADPSARYRDGLINPGAPQVRGAGQAGGTLATQGWVPGVPIEAGIFLSFGTGAETRFHQVLSGAIANASGHADLQISPELREAPANNLPIEIHHPKVHLRLSAPVPSSVGLGDFYRFSFTAEEAL